MSSPLERNELGLSTHELFEEIGFIVDHASLRAEYRSLRELREVADDSVETDDEEIDHDYYENQVKHCRTLVKIKAKLERIKNEIELELY